MKKRRRAMPAPDFQQPETLLATADEVIQEQFCVAKQLDRRRPQWVIERKRFALAWGKRA
jgi:hypothetical protein